jgi:hypothetical protein
MKMEEDLNFLILEDNINFLKMEDDQEKCKLNQQHIAEQATWHN